jgi:hypothetical protein
LDYSIIENLKQCNNEILHNSKNCVGEYEYIAPEKKEVLRKKLIPVPLCPPYIPH